MTRAEAVLRVLMLRRRACRALTGHRWRTTAVTARADNGRTYHIARCRVCGQPEVTWLT